MSFLLICLCRYKERTELPTCLTKQIKLKYPSPSHTYVGYKVSAQPMYVALIHLCVQSLHGPGYANAHVEPLAIGAGLMVIAVCLLSIAAAYLLLS